MKTWEVPYNRIPKKAMYVNLETGELLTYKEALQQAENEYDFGDYTNCCEFWEYFELAADAAGNVIFA